MLNRTFDWDEVDSLIRLLHTHGISYLMGNGSSGNKHVDNVELVHLIERLADCGYPLVENASISLFLLHPELAPSIVEALQRSEGECAEAIAVLTLATLYLQQWWVFRLAFALGRLPSFPEAPFVFLWQDRHLPSPTLATAWTDFWLCKPINSSVTASLSMCSMTGTIRSIISFSRRKPRTVNSLAS